MSAEVAIPGPRDRSATPSSRSGRRAKSSKPLALPFGSAPLDTEEGRQFLQERIALVSLVAFSLSAFAFVASHLLMMGSVTHGFWTCMEQHGGWWHVAAAGMSLSAWLVTRRGRLSHPALVVVDVAGTLLALTAYALMAASDTGMWGNRLDLVMMLIVMIVLTVRAVVVPSSVSHTVMVSLAGTLPVLWLAHHNASIMSPELLRGITPWAAVAYMGIWTTMCVAVAALASRIVYGLRAEVAEARRLGQYVLDEKIGEGGMGAVYRARHALLRRPTAIKLILPERAGAGALARFEREVQLTAQLSHPNTVSIFDYGRTPDGVFYYAMELLDGVDLQTLVERFGPQDPSRVVHVMTQVASSLAEAHAIGLVHRDVKPANVILCERGGMPDVAKVVDFGLVKDVASLGRDLTLSRVDTLLGTPLYLAPESLVAPNQVDGRADLYALAAVGYFLLSGRPVFEASSVMEVCAQHLHAEPERPSARLGEPLPRELEDILLRCLAKKPEERFATAGQLRDALLASSVPPWGPALASAWWQQHGKAARQREATPARRPSERDTIAVDYADRAAE
jgi:hypothetical protein